MSTELKRLTFAITPEMEPIIDRAKQMFYDRTQSDMIRTLIIAGLDTLDNKERNEQLQEASEPNSTGSSHV